MLRFATSLALFAACASPSTGCSSGPGGPEVVSWLLADGRDCFSAGVSVVEARTSSSLKTTPVASVLCPAGLAPATTTIDNLVGSGTLYLDGVDGLGIDLYHGELSLEAAPPATGETRVVTLYAAAAQ